ncbi:putative lipid II flippase FtsW [Candidatus Dependentiae bacterium]
MQSTQEKKYKIKTDLNLFLLTVTTLIAIGLVFIYSSSSVYALEKFGCPHYFVKKQAFGLFLGIIGMIVAFVLPLKFIKKMTPLIFWGTFLLTGATLITSISQTIHGSSRWIKIFGFGFQPSEMLKLAIIMYIAYFISKKQDNLSSFFNAYLPVIIIVGATSLVLLKQPDFGLTVTLATTVFIMLFVAKFNPKHLFFSVLALIPSAITLVYLKPYRLKRIVTFLNPWKDPQGSGFQIIQSLIAIGSGGFWGVGISNSKQKFFYLPMQHTDFIFSIIAEETGFIGSLGILMLFITLFYFGMRISWQITDIFSRFTVMGFVALISLQAVINLAVATGLVPTKGIGLPFVSYGNTSLVCSLCMIGLIVNIVYSNAEQKI